MIGVNLQDCHMVPSGICNSPVLEVFVIIQARGAALPAFHRDSYRPAHIATRSLDGDTTHRMLSHVIHIPRLSDRLDFFTSANGVRVVARA